MRTAKELFRAHASFRDFEQILANPAFEPACQAAIAALLEEYSLSTTDVQTGWDAHMQVMGARRVLNIFSRLSQTDETPKEKKPPALNYAKT